MTESRKDLQSSVGLRARIFDPGPLLIYIGKNHLGRFSNGPSRAGNFEFPWPSSVSGMWSEEVEDEEPAVGTTRKLQICPAGQRSKFFLLGSTCCDESRENVCMRFKPSKKEQSIWSAVSAVQSEKKVSNGLSALFYDLR